MAENDKRFYWLKLKRDFFKRHDITVIENMPNGKDYLLFYMKLLLESIDHEGQLRFSDEIPYNEGMLSAITNTNIDVVKSAIKIFSQLKMMDILDDGTIYMREVQSMLGTESYWAEAKRKQREYNNNKELLDNVQQMSNESPICPSKSIDIDLDIDKDIELDKVKNTRFTKPTLEELTNFIEEEKLTVDAQYFMDYYESNGWNVGKAKMKDWKATVRNWNRRNFTQNNYSKKIRQEMVTEMPIDTKTLSISEKEDIMNALKNLGKQ